MPLPRFSLRPFDRLHPDVALPLALFVFGALILTMASARFGIADGEAPSLDAAAGYGRLVEAAARGGLSSVTRDDVAKELGTARSFPLFPHGAAGLSWLVLARRTTGPWVSELFALRLPSLLASAGVPALVYLLARGALARRWAVLAGVLALLGPRLLIDGVSLGGGGPLVAATLVALLGHRLADKTGSWAAAVLGGVGLGCAVSQSLAPLLVLVLPVLAAFGSGAREPLDDGGIVRLSRGSLGWLVVGVPCAYLLSPSLQPLSTDVILAVFERTLAPVLSGTRALGRLPTALAPPRWQALEALVLGVPSLTLVLALIGLASLSPHIARLRDGSRHAARWAWAHAALFVLWPALVPRALGSYPAAWQLAVPFLAIAAGHGARLLGGLSRRETAVAALCLVEPIVSSLDFPSAAAASGWLVPPPSRQAGLAPFDAAIAGSLIPTVVTQPAGAPPRAALRIYAPDLPPDVWEASRRWKRLPRSVVPVRKPEDADLVVLAAEAPVPRDAAIVLRRSRAGRTVLTVSRPVRPPP